MEYCVGIWYNRCMKHTLINKRFGKLIVLKEVGRAKDRSVIWECQCDCGNKTNTTSRSLMCQDTKSCGCLRKISSGEANFNKLLANYKNSAKVRNVPFTLSDEQFRELTQEKCFYCGSEPSQEKYRKFSNGAYVFNGIDRKDNSKGYVQGNVLPCCFICNRAKGNMSYEDFSLWIKRIVKR